MSEADSDQSNMHTVRLDCVLSEFESKDRVGESNAPGHPDAMCTNTSPSYRAPRGCSYRSWCIGIVALTRGTLKASSPALSNTVCSTRHSRETSEVTPHFTCKLTAALSISDVMLCSLTKESNTSGNAGYNRPHSITVYPTPSDGEHQQWRVYQAMQGITGYTADKKHGDAPHIRA